MKNFALIIAGVFLLHTNCYSSNFAKNPEQPPKTQLLQLLTGNGESQIYMQIFGNFLVLPNTCILVTETFKDPIFKCEDHIVLFGHLPSFYNHEWSQSQPSNAFQYCGLEVVEYPNNGKEFIMVNNGVSYALFSPSSSGLWKASLFSICEKHETTTSNK